MTVGDLRERLFDLPDNVELMFCNAQGTYLPMQMDPSIWPVMHKEFDHTITAAALVFQTAPGDVYRKDGNKLR